MILRPLDPVSPKSTEPVEAWPVIERLQRNSYENCWMITQPSHAALAGHIAARLSHPRLPQVDPSLVRAIALHDAGWGLRDAQAITRSRGRQNEAPKSFLQTEIPDFLAAWTQSIDIAQNVSLAGGYIVSRHFWRLAEHRVTHGEDAQFARKKLQGFLSSEFARQKKLSAGQERADAELEGLTDLLQFCDVFSLYICCGAQQEVRFPEYCGVQAKLEVDRSTYRLDPPLVGPGSKFAFAALRYPFMETESSREFQLTVE